MNRILTVKNECYQHVKYDLIILLTFCELILPLEVLRADPKVNK